MGGNEMLQLTQAAEYPWLSLCDDPEQEIEILEESLQRGIMYSKELVKLVEIFSDHGDMTSTGFPMEKIPDLESIWAEQEKFKISVGFGGTTGAGKTTAINALLGYYELLPSGSDGAATGTVCIVHNNENQDPNKRFRAEVKFKNKKVVEKWLDDFFKELHMAIVENEQADDESQVEVIGDDSHDVGVHGVDSIADESRDRQGLECLKEYLDPIYDVWKYEEEELLAMSSKDILTKDDAATKLLSKTKCIAFPDLETFSDAIKPYLDCTPLPGVETAKGEEMQVWPLVEKVDVWVPSPLLENGLVVEDLPGVSDSMQMRANVARDRYKSLDITIIMSPVIRAADEGNTWELITDNHALQLQMDGKFNAHQFCIAVTKIDDLDWRSYLKRTLRPESGTDLHTANQDLQEVQQSLQWIEEEIQKASREGKSAGQDAKVEAALNNDGDGIQKTNNGKPPEKRRYSRLLQQKDILEKKRGYLEGYLAFLCTKARSKKVSTKLLETTRRKKSAVKGNKLNLGEVPIFPISGREFWSLRTANAKPNNGFPTDDYTGIPALAKWIRDVTIPARKRHALALLHRLNVILNVLLAWCTDVQLVDGTLGLSSDTLQEICAKFKDSLHQNLKDYSAILTTRVKTCNPINMIKVKPFKPKCRPDILNQVSRWNLLQPEVQDSQRMNWSTHAAIIRRFGDTYTSSGRNKITYSWMDDMSDRILLDIVEAWDDCFHVKLPEEAKKAKDELELVWRVSMSKVRALLPKFFPDHLPYFADQLRAILGIQEETMQSIEHAMFHLVTESANVYPAVREEMTRGWKCPFMAASGFSGRGCFNNRQIYLDRVAIKCTTTFIKSAISKMETRMNHNMDLFEKSLSNIWNEVIAKIDSQINTICSRICKSERGHIMGEESEAREKELRQNASQWITKWQSDWKHPDVLSCIHIARADVSIPKEYVEEPEGYALPDYDLDEEEELTSKARPQKRKRQRKSKAAPQGSGSMEGSQGPAKRAKTGKTAKTAKTVKTVKTEGVEN